MPSSVAVVTAIVMIVVAAVKEHVLSDSAAEIEMMTVELVRKDVLTEIAPEEQRLARVLNLGMRTTVLKDHGSVQRLVSRLTDADQIVHKL